MLNFVKNKKKSEEEKINYDLSLDQEIEAILFFKADEVNLKYLVKILNKKKKEIKEAITVLKQRLENSALMLIEDNDRYLLAIKPTLSNIIEKIKEKDEYGELSPSALETLAVVLYKKEVSRQELDLIRGVNSSYILRNLLIRGLINKKNENGTVKYIPSLDLLSFLGVDNVEKMPAFDTIRKKIEEIENRENEIIKEENGENQETTE
jgi:segregation and condensation protein B